MRFSRILPLLAAALLAPLAAASNVDPVFYPDQGRVVLPNLKVGNQIYFVVLKKLGATNDFRLDGTSVAVVGPPLAFTPATAAEIVGSWVPEGIPAQVTINANGTYSMTEGAQGDPSCPNGGAESGNYQYEPATGVIVMVATADANGTCGFSHSDQVTRAKKVGADLFFFFKDDGMNVEIKLTRKP